MNISIIALPLIIRNSLAKLDLKDADNFTANFKSIIETPYFVDKTDFIETFFLPSSRCKPISITTPRGFGKTTNMDMLKQFAQVRVDENGNRIRKNETENYRIFTDKYLKDNSWDYLNVYKNKSFFHNHFGEYPVIHLDFKQLCGGNWEVFERRYRIFVKQEFIAHKYLLNSDRLNGDDKEEFNIYYDTDETLSPNSSSVYVDMVLYESLEFLSKILFKHFDKGVIVLMDDYDFPLQEAIFHSGKDMVKIVNYIEELIHNLLFSNIYVERSLINSCILMAPISSPVMTSDRYIILTFGQKHSYAKFYGLTVDEVKTLTGKFNISEQMADIEEWYGGYRIVNDDMRLFNTHSIVSYLQKRSYENYWGETGYIGELARIFTSECLGYRIESVVNNSRLILPYPQRVDVSSVKVLRDIVSNGRVEEKDSDSFLNFLLNLGYFTILDAFNRYVVIKVPNEEVRRGLQKSLYVPP